MGDNEEISNNLKSENNSDVNTTKSSTLDVSDITIKEELFNNIDKVIEQNRSNIEINLNKHSSNSVESNQPSTSGKGVNYNLTQDNHVLGKTAANSITVYNGENATCTILTNALPAQTINSTVKPSTQMSKSTSTQQSDPQLLPRSNNSVILIFTHNQINESIVATNNQAGSVQTDTEQSECQHVRSPPDYSAVMNIISDTNPYKLTVRSQFDNPNMEITLPPIHNVPANLVHIPPPLASAPPSYSAVLRLGPLEASQRNRLPFIRNQPSPSFIAPPPPPSYAEVQGHYSARDLLATCKIF